LIIGFAAALLFGGGSAQRRFGDGGPFGDNDDDGDGSLTLKAALKQGFVDATGGAQVNVSKHIRPQF
jgi:hypothetical protein